jgi:preprotein translocase subunit SecF
MRLHLGCECVTPSHYLLNVWVYAHGSVSMGTVIALLLDVLIVFECMEVFTWKYTTIK